MNAIRIAFAGGGTGGHLLPGISVAQAGAFTSSRSRFLFLGTAREAERLLFETYGFPRVELDIHVPRRSPRGALRFGRELFGAVAEAGRTLAAFRPHAVVGLGGYAAVPGVLAAVQKGVPVYLMEQNASVGRAVAFLAPLARAVFCGFQDTARGFGAKGVYSGNPLRADLLRHLGRTRTPGARRSRTLLVMGGSQGARGINDMMMNVAHRLTRVPRLDIIHLAGPDADLIRDIYRQAGFPDAKVIPFDPDVGRFLRRADLVVSRAGAMAISEITAFARPALFIPYPYAGGHQAVNARPLVQRGAAALCHEGRLGSERLASMLLDLLNDGERLGRMSERSSRLARPDASRLVFERLLGDLALPAAA